MVMNMKVIFRMMKKQDKENIDIRVDKSIMVILKRVKKMVMERCISPTVIATRECGRVV